MKRFFLDPSQAAGDLYSSVIVSPGSIAQRASSTRVLKTVAELTSRLSADKYTTYVAEFYERGVAIAGEEWGFMDIISVLYSAAEMGQPENYLEIGVRRGRSACAVAAASPKTHIYAFDMWQQGYAGNENPGPELVRREISKAGHVGTLDFIDGDSHETIPDFFRQNPSLSFDCITVDGDHSLKGAWDDLRNVAPRLRVGGVLVFDDTNNPYCPGLELVWERLLQEDKGLCGYSYNQLGTGVSFAVRVRDSAFRCPSETISAKATSLGIFHRYSENISIKLQSNANFKNMAKQLCPPLIWNGLRAMKAVMAENSQPVISDVSNKPTALNPVHHPKEQKLDIYWDPQMAEILDTWGEGTVWNEIQLLLASCEGRVLDIACGTGAVIEMLATISRLDVYGCDISDLLINKAIARGISQDRLKIADATKMDYSDNCFNYAYSIGSLEHFTEEGIIQFLRESSRVTCKASFHQVPVSRHDYDEGWITIGQSYYNNSVNWWLEKFTSVYKKVYVLDSAWECPTSLGKWFVCINEQ